MARGQSAGGIRAGRAFILIEAIDATSAGIRQVTASLDKLGQRMQSIGRGIAMRAGGGLAFLGFNVAEFARFDDAMRSVQARSRGTMEDLQALRMEAMRLGRTTAFTAEEIANLAVRVSQRGFTRRQTLAALQPMSALARAGGSSGNLGTDLVTSADLITATINQFRGQFTRDVTDMTRVSDIFATATAKSDLTLEDLVENMAKAGTIMNANGYTLEQTVSLMGALADANTKASEAGTALRNNVINIAAGLEDFNDELNKQQRALGLTQTRVKGFTEEGGLKSLEEILGAIVAVTEDLGPAAQQVALFDILGKRAGVPGKVIAELSDRVRELQAEFEGADGAAMDMMETMEAGIGGALRRLRSAFSGLRIGIGEALAGPVANSNQAVIKFLDTISKWVNENQLLVGIIGASVVAITAFGAALWVAGAAITTFAGFVTFLMSPVGLFGLAAVLAAAVVYVYDLGGAATAATKAFAFLSEEVTRTFKGMSDALASGDLELAFQIVTLEIEYLWKKMIDAMLDVWDQFILDVVGIMERNRTLFLAFAMLTGNQQAIAAFAGMTSSGGALESIQAADRARRNELLRIRSDQRNLEARAAGQRRITETRARMLEEQRQRQVQPQMPDLSQSIQTLQSSGALRQFFTAAEGLDAYRKGIENQQRQFATQRAEEAKRDEKRNKLLEDIRNGQKPAIGV